MLCWMPLIRLFYCHCCLTQQRLPFCSLCRRTPLIDHSSRTQRSFCWDCWLQQLPKYRGESVWLILVMAADTPEEDDLAGVGDNLLDAVFGHMQQVCWGRDCRRRQRQHGRQQPTERPSYCQPQLPPQACLQHSEQIIQLGHSRHQPRAQDHLSLPQQQD